MHYVIDQNLKVLFIAGSQYSSVRFLMNQQNRRERMSKIYRELNKPLSKKFDYTLSVVVPSVNRNVGDTLKLGEFVVVSKEQRS